MTALVVSAVKRKVVKPGAQSYDELKVHLSCVWLI